MNSQSKVGKEAIYVTRPALPPLEEFTASLENIWNSRQLTNGGPMHEEFEHRLAEYLGVKHVSLFCNGMIALQIGLQALKITGEVITTPFSFTATTHAVYWNGCTPVFCDINPSTFTIDPARLESLISPRTTAILPVHVYGTPCDYREIQRIADLYGLKVFYDAAHAFGVREKGVSILNCGDLSMLSFHATKVFNTFEGGALITDDPKLKTRIDFLKNFGFANETTVVAPGSNGKMNEFQAALGLLQLKHIDHYVAKRQQIADLYRTELAGIDGITVIHDYPDITHNYAYFPILIDREKFGMTRDEVYDKFRALRVFVRRYFYPLISTFPCYRNLPSAMPEKLPNAVRTAEQILCLPIYPDLDHETVRNLCERLKARFA